MHSVQLVHSEQQGAEFHWLDEPESNRGMTTEIITMHSAAFANLYDYQAYHKFKQN